MLDLTAIGNNLTIQQWYGGLLSQVGQQLDLEDELLDFWAERSLLGPLQLWMRAIWAPDNQRIATGSADGTVKLWDPKTGLETATFRANAGNIFAVAFAPDGLTLAVACQDSTVKLWRAASKDEAH